MNVGTDRTGGHLVRRAQRHHRGRRWTGGSIALAALLTACSATVVGEIDDDEIRLEPDSAPVAVTLELTNVGSEDCRLAIGVSDARQELVTSMEVNDEPTDDRAPTLRSGDRARVVLDGTRPPADIVRFVACIGDAQRAADLGY